MAGACHRHFGTPSALVHRQTAVVCAQFCALRLLEGGLTLSTLPQAVPTGPDIAQLPVFCHALSLTAMEADTAFHPSQGRHCKGQK